MSRFVRASKYRHVYAQSGKKEYGYENVKVTNSAWDTNIVSASGKYVSINWNAAGGGAFAILPLPNPFNATPISGKLPDWLPLARSHTAPVLDTDWSPHNDSIVASGGEDGKVIIWNVNDSMFDGWNTEGWEPRDLEPVVRIDASPRKVGQVLFHPTAESVVASASGEHVVKLWDLKGGVEDPRSVLGGHTDAIQSICFNTTGTLLATTCRDRKIRMFDPRAGSEAVRVGEGHSGIKGARVVWMGDLDRIATTGFSKMSDRQVAIWETGGLGNVKTIVLDQSSGIVMPFWSDNNILFLAGKGDGNIRFYEYESDSLHPLSEHKSSDPQRGMCFLPRRALNVSDCEIARAYKVVGSAIEPIGFIVPRKADSFQSDIFPPAPSSEPSLSASEFFSGKPVSKKLVDLQTGAVSGAPATSSSSSAPTPSFSAPTPTPAAVSSPASYTPTSQAPPMAASKSYSAPAPQPIPEPSPIAEPSHSAPTPSAAVAASNASSSGAAEVSSLRDENAQLTAELREARALIRNLELQVESTRANMRKAQALLDSV